MLLIDKQINYNNKNINDQNSQINSQNLQMRNGISDGLVNGPTQLEHIPAFSIKNTELVLRRSSLPNEIAGIFTLKNIDKDTVFGPYVGEIVHAKNADLYKGRYSWEIYSSKNHLLHRIDATDLSRSNWMRFINLTVTSTLQNLAAFQQNSNIFYQATRDVPAGEELLVWFSDTYNQDYVQRVKEKKDYSAYKRKLAAVKKVKLTLDSTTAKFHCDSCDFFTNIKNLYTNHLLSHISNKLYKCNLCDASFAYKHVLDFHRNTHPEYQAVHHPFPCPSCTADCETQDALDAHVCSHHCDTCGVAMPSALSLANHKRIHLKDTLPLDSLSHICEFCGFESMNARSLWKHKNRRHAEEVLKCSICEVVCSNKTAFRLHMQRHSGYKPYKCDQCEESFVLTAQLKQHKTRHAGVIQHKCPVCDCIFQGHNNLKAHIRRHVNEKRFKCEICEENFAKAAELRKHKRTHTGDKPYVCDVCGVSFAQKLSLQIHTRVHTGEKPYKCLTCGACFAYHNSLYVHKRSHTGEKPYKCTVCDAAFSQSGSLKGHMRIHTGEKPFKCDLCSSVFAQRVSLKSHICVGNEFIPT